MNVVCPKCGTKMTGDCQLTAPGRGLFDGNVVSVNSGGAAFGLSARVCAFMCPKCGYLERYTDRAKDFAPPPPPMKPEEKAEPEKLEEAPPEENKKEPWFRKKNDDPWE